MKVAVLDTKGNKVEDITLSDKVFKIEPNTEVLKQYLRVYSANQRQGTSSAKTRAEVSGGGRKPWRQKGTGRARHGSTRSPIWTHGGVAHGPRPKDWCLKLPKKVRALALKSALSLKFANKQALVVNEIKLKEPKTKEIVTILNKLKVADNVLIVKFGKNDNLVKSTSNIQGVKLNSAEDINAFDLVWAKNVVFLKAAVESLENKYK